MAETKKCPHCLSPIKDTTFLCPRCNKLVDKSVPRSPTPEEQKKTVTLFLAVAGGLLFLMILMMSNCSTGTDKQASAPKHLDRATVLAQVDKLIETNTEESTMKAMEMIHANFGAEQLRTDRVVSAKLQQAVDALGKISEPRTEEIFAERVDSYWIPKLKSREVLRPVGTTEIWAAVNVFEDMARELKTASAYESAKAKDARARLKSALKAAQIKAFPFIRSAYALTLREALWTFDVEVHAEGATSKAIRLTGYRYAANANIADTQMQNQTNLTKLRFTKAIYQWAKYADYSTYTMTVPADADIGYWDRNQFVGVK